MSLPSAFTRERNNVKRKGIFRPKSMIIDEDSASAPGKGFFTQQNTDAKVFMEEHFQVKISPFPNCHQIARKDNLWYNYKVNCVLKVMVLGSVKYLLLCRECGPSMAGSILTSSQTPSSFLRREKP